MVLVQEEGYVQAKYFEDIQDLSAPEVLLESKNPYSRTVKENYGETKQEIEVLDMFLNVRKREEFYQGKMKNSLNQRVLTPKPQNPFVMR